MRRHLVHNLKACLAATILLISAHLSTLLAQDSPAAPSPAAQAAARLELSAIGYHEPSRFDRLSENEPSVTVDFVDAGHVLLTFNRKKLVQRLPGCTPDHEDRLMHAAILEVPSGKVVQEADWYLHDRRRYLWPLGPGKFLLRQLNDLYVVDSELHQKLLMSSPRKLLWAAVTPDASQIVIETEKDGTPAKSAKPQSASAKPEAKSEAKFEVQFLDAKTLAPQRTIPLNDAVNLTGVSSGYVDLVQKGDVWLLRFGSTTKHRRNLARVRSRTIPHVLYSSNNSLVVGRCPAPDCDYSVTAFTLNGRRLWQQHWPRQRFFPAVAHSQDNSRFGVSTLRLVVDSALTKAANAPGEEDNAFHLDLSQLEVLQQQVQIFDTASGHPVLSVEVSPSVESGQNFSLSPDGRQLAVLQATGLELYDLPPMSQEEQTSFAALKSDLPDLYTLGSESDTSSLTADGSRDASAEATAAAVDAANSPTASAASAGQSADQQASSVDNTASPAPAAPSSGPTAADSSEPIPTIRVVTRAVLVDVVVTDSKGHPVKGLRQQDFQLAEDGKTQDVRNFREFTGGAATDASPSEPPASATASAAAPTAKPSPNTFSNHSHAPDSGAVTMILFDLLNTGPQDQAYARAQLIKFLQTKPANAVFALCTLSAGDSRLHLVQGFTADETRLLAAAKGKKGAPKAVRWQASASEAANSVTTVNNLAQEGPTSGFQGLLSALQQMQAEQQVTDTDERAGYTLDAMMLLSRYLSGIPGRKNLIWLSGSFPISISATINSGDPSLDNPNYTYKIKRVTNLLGDAQVAVYPVDVRGLLGGGLSADGPGGMGGPSTINQPDFNAASVISPSSVIPQDMQALAQQADERETLLQFASETGGKAFLNSNGIRDAIAIATEQGSNYYTLSYSPANKNYDGKFRKIKVALAEKGYTLHYRLGYFADDSNSAAKDAELARRARATAMQHGSPPSRQIVFSARVVPVGGKKKMDRALVGEVLLASTKKAPTLPAQIETQHYSIDYTFAGSEMRFIPLQNASYRNTLTLMVSSFDSDGRMLTGIANVGVSDLPPAVYKTVVAGEFGVHQEADVPAEAVSLRLGIQDQMSNHIGTVDIPLPLPSAPDAPRRVRQSLPEIEPD